MKQTFWIVGIVLSLAAAVIILHGISFASEQAEKDDIVFYDARKQAAEFIGYYNSITLTAKQEQVKKEALSAIPAPCCGDYSIATCCCPCNLAKSVWGLSHFLIVEKGYGAEKVREVVNKWIGFINPDGYTGNSCYTGRCPKPFRENGCGGMDEKHIS